MNVLTAFDLPISQREFDEAKVVFPRHRADSSANLKKFLAHCVGAVHSIASDLHNPKERGKLKIYFGRSSEETSLLVNRWRDSEFRREHEFGVVLCSMPTRETRFAENAAIRLFKVLEDSNTICIGSVENKSLGSCGRIPSSETSLIYATWTVPSNGTEYLVKKISRADIQSYTDSMDVEMLSKSSLRSILELTRTYGFKTPIKWHNP